MDRGAWRATVHGVAESVFLFKKPNFLSHLCPPGRPRPGSCEMYLRSQGRGDGRGKVVSGRAQGEVEAFPGSPFPAPQHRLSFQNLVMFMSDFVDWVIPDIPKDISQQIHKEKVLMVELFMREEQGKQQLLDTWMEKDRKKAEPCNNHSPAPAAPPPPPDGPDFPGGSL